MSETYRGTLVRSESKGEETVEIDGETVLVRGYEYIYDWEHPIEEVGLDDLDDVATSKDQLEANPAVVEYWPLVRASDL